MSGYFADEEHRPRAATLAEALVGFVAEQLEALAERHAPGLVLPRVFAGHAIGPDTRSDLAYTASFLFEAGRKELAGVPLDDAVLAILRSLDGRATDTFYSYRAAESLARIGGYHDNPRLAGLAETELANLREAFDSSRSVEDVRAGRLPQNYAVVVARCEEARDRLGLLDDRAILEELLGRCRELMAQTAHGWIDDSQERRGQHDIYTTDVFLFAEPLAGYLGELFSTGLRRVLRDVDALALPGGAIVWGRSIGSLGLAMTVELAALGAARGLVDAPGDWLARAAWAFDELRRWFSGGVIRAHQHRSPMFYRGPSRRLQLTFDVLGKLAAAALELRKVPDLRAGAPMEAWRPVDRYVRMGAPGRNEQEGAWGYRSRALSFVLPLVDGYSTDYLPAPRAPGTLETPTSGPISMVPVVHRKGRPLVAAGAPLRVEHGDGTLLVEYRGWKNVGADPGQEATLEGGRVARYRVEGRSLAVEEEITLDAEPKRIDALSLQVPEVARRPLRVELEADVPHRADRIDVEGLAEYRSFWSELPTVHQLDVEPARRTRIRWRVTPHLRVSSTADEQQYNRSLYAPLEGRVVTRQAHPDVVHSPRELAKIDVLHVHWPEWWQGLDLDRNRQALDRLRDAGTRIVWTQHNLLPHRARGEDAEALYRLWAERADAVIHHTRWGREQVLARYRYREDALHRLIPHGHWGRQFAVLADVVDRREVEKELGLEPCAMRLGVVGAPRIEKDVQLVLDAFHACSRQDLQLLVVCIDGEEVPDDPRILALPARFENVFVYHQRLAAIDAIVFPFREGMLMTGTAFDAIGGAKAAIVSDWPLLGEVFGDAAIRYGSSRDDLRDCLEALTPEKLAASAAGMASLQRQTDWSDIAEQHFELLDELASR